MGLVREYSKGKRLRVNGKKYVFVYGTDISNKCYHRVHGSTYLSCLF